MNETLINLARSTSVKDVLDFCAALGWSQVTHPNDRLSVLSRANDSLPPVQFVFPQNEIAPDYPLRIVEIAAVLGEILEASPEVVLHRIQQVTSDVVRARLISKITEGNSVPLSDAVRIVESFKSLIAYAATAEASPLPFHVRPSGRGLKHANHCRFGHTFPGSFGFTIESPLAPQIQATLPQQEHVPPFERRVVERVYRGLEQLKTSIVERQLDPIVKNYDSGLNANMCDALLSMRENAPDLSIVYSVDWSPKIPEVELAKFTAIEIGPESNEYLEAAAKQLRTADETIKVSIFGPVVLLKSDSAPWEDETDEVHSIAVAWVDEHGRSNRTRVVLGGSDYMLACEAHMRGQTVAVDGLLERRGKYSRLLDATNFRIGPQMALL